MRQLIMNAQGVSVVEVPTPSVAPGAVLVRVQKSLISIGTELAPLKHSGNAEKPFLENIQDRTSAYQDLLGKAVKHPDKVVRRLKIEFDRRFLGKFSKDRVNNYDGWNIGYSLAGFVVATGDGVNDISAGDVVSCCGAGWANHADYVSLLTKMPAGLDPRFGAFGTVAGIAMQGVRRADPQLASNLGVVGLGLVGQIAVRLLTANGCNVIGFDPDPKRAGRVPEGVHHVSDEKGFIKGVEELSAGHGLDAVLICAATSSSDPVNLSMKVTRRRGRVVIVGDIGINVERAAFYRNEIDLLMSTSYGPGRYDASYEIEGHDYPYAYVRWTLNRNIQACLDIMASGLLDLDSLIDREVSLDEAPDIYQELAGSDGGQLIGVLLDYEKGQSAETSGVTRIRETRLVSGRQLNFALSGIGAFGVSMLLPTMRDADTDNKLTAVVSRDPLRAGHFAHENNIDFIATSVSELVEKADIDALIIANRHNQHSTDTKAALMAGVHVFCEKPLAVNWDQLNDVADCYRHKSNDATLMVGFNRRFSPAVQILKPILAARKSPLMMHYRINAGYIPPDHWVQTKEGGGRNVGEACHMYDLFRYLADCEVKSIEAAAISSSGSTYLPSDNFSATLTYKDGSVATLVYTSMGPKTGLEKEHLEVFVDGEAYSLSDYHTLIRASDGHVLWTNEITDKGHQNEINKWVKSLRDGDPSPIDAEEIFETTAVSLAIEDLIHGRMNG